ncbi:MAG: type II secretion system F family protein [Acidobacteriia bacterium]|nr:type II secretion system F family protein [Terriglobia bacterium]
MALLIAFVTFIVATVLGLLIWLSFGADSKQELIQRRMDAVRRAERRGPIDLGVRLIRDELLSSVPAVNRIMMKWSWSTRLKDVVAQAGMKTRPGKILLICGVLAFGAFVATGALYSFPVPILAAMTTGMLPLMYVGIRRRRRLRQFEEHFPEALDLLNRAIRAGHAFTTGLGMIASEAPEPIAGEFRTTFEEQNFGLPLRDVLQNLSDRVPLIDVRFFVTALLIQKETGGNLSEILDNLSHVIRDRFRIYRDVRSKSAHGRLTAGILIALPPIMVLSLGIVNPHYMSALVDDPIGPKILWGAATWQLIGSALLWKIIHIEV